MSKELTEKQQRLVDRLNSVYTTYRADGAPITAKHDDQWLSGFLCGIARGSMVRFDDIAVGITSDQAAVMIKWSAGDEFIMYPLQIAEPA